VFRLNDAKTCNAKTSHHTFRSYEKRKASKKKRKNLAVLAKTPRLHRFSWQNFQAVALTRAPENEGENQDISLETTFTLSLASHVNIFFFRCFCL